ncbi:MAG: DUF2089 family protein [Rhizomicrobium sp.]
MATETSRWTEVLSSDELNFIRHFVLSSGSLKEMAEEYGVSYPTIRQRLDALIAKMADAMKEKPVTELRRVVRRMVEHGELDLPEARKLLRAGDNDLKQAERTRGGSDS